MADYTVKMTKEKAEEARRLHKSGWSVKKLCAYFGLSDTSMYDILKGKSWPLENLQLEEKEKYIFYDQIIAAYEKGMATKQISEIFGCSVTQASAVKRYLNKAKEKTIGEKEKELNGTLYAWAILRTLQWAQQNGLINAPEKPLQREPITAEDWKAVACHFAKKYNDGPLKLGALLRMFEHDTVQIHFEDSGEDWDKATEIPADSPLLKSVLSWRIKEAEIVESNIYEDQHILRLGIFEAEEDEE